MVNLDPKFVEPIFGYFQCFEFKTKQKQKQKQNKKENLIVLFNGRFCFTENDER